MNTEYITLTDLDIERCMTANGGFRSETVRLLGEDVMVKGWRVRLRGKRVLRTIYDAARGAGTVPKLKGVRYGESIGQTYLI